MVFCILGNGKQYHFLSKKSGKEHALLLVDSLDRFM